MSKKNMRKTIKKITLETLAIMVQKGFEEVLDTTAKKADLEAFRNETNQRFDKVEQKLDNVIYQAEFYELKTRVDNLEKRILSLKK